MNNNQDQFSTKDLYLAATLITLGFQKVGVDYQIEGMRRMPVGYFLFEKTPELHEAEKKFWGGQLAVEPRAFITAMRSLKAEVNNNYKDPHISFNNRKK